MGTLQHPFQWYKCFTEFCYGRTSTSDTESMDAQLRWLHPKIWKLHDMVKLNQRLKVPEIAEVIGIWHDWVNSILNIFPTWVPSLLTFEHKRNRVTSSWYNEWYKNKTTVERTESPRITSSKESSPCEIECEYDTVLFKKNKVNQGFHLQVLKRQHRS